TAQHVRGAPGGEGDDQLDGLVGIAGRVAACQRRGTGYGQAAGCQGGLDECFHGFSLTTLMAPHFFWVDEGFLSSRTIIATCQLSYKKKWQRSRIFLAVPVPVPVPVPVAVPVTVVRLRFSCLRPRTPFPKRA